MVHRRRLTVRHVRRGRWACHGGVMAEREALVAVNDLVPGMR